MHEDNDLTEQHYWHHWFNFLHDVHYIGNPKAAVNQKVMAGWHKILNNPNFARYEDDPVICVLNWAWPLPGRNFDELETHDIQSLDRAAEDEMDDD